MRYNRSLKLVLKQLGFTDEEIDDLIGKFSAARRPRNLAKNQKY
jgi:hypothetical protein